LSQTRFCIVADLRKHATSQTHRSDLEMGFLKRHSALNGFLGEAIFPSIRPIRDAPYRWPSNRYRLKRKIRTLYFNGHDSRTWSIPGDKGIPAWED